jgi:lysophospholipase L1-like esterase
MPLRTMSISTVLLAGSGLSAGPNTCTTNVGTFLNNTDYADGSGPRVAKNAADCCNQCIAARNCQFWSFNIDDKSYPGVTDCKWAHLTYCCYFHADDTNPVKGRQSPGTKGVNGWTSGGFTGKKPGPPPPPPPCPSFTTKATCPARCVWDDEKVSKGSCHNKPPPPPPPGPCSHATQAQCGVGKPPYDGTKVYCANACTWNGTACNGRKPTGYPLPANDSLVALVGPDTPLAKLTTHALGQLKWSFYGDSITWLNLYEGVISKALAASPATQGLNISLIDQGVNGGTVTDLVAGFSPWGHLDPHVKQTNISFAETLKRDQPDIIGIQIGENDVMQQPSRGENVSVYTEVLREQVVKVAQATGAKVYLATISVIGEEVNNTNHAKILK